jgi:hypothetical protein
VQEQATGENSRVMAQPRAPTRRTGMMRQPDEKPTANIVDRLGRERIFEIAARTSDMLSIPLWTCPVRRCRRARSCQRIATEGNLPVCFPTLPSKFVPCYENYLCLSVMICADARDGEHGEVFRQMEPLAPDMLANAAWVARQCLADNAAALACLDATLTLIADAASAPPAFWHPDESAQAAP